MRLLTLRLQELKYRRNYNISLRCILSVTLIISLSLFSSSSSPYLLPFIMQGKVKETTLVLPAGGSNAIIVILIIIRSTSRVLNS